MVDLGVLRKEPIYSHYTSSCQVSLSSNFWHRSNKHGQKHRHTDRHTHKHNDADENNTCPKTKFLGQVNIKKDIKGWTSLFPP